MPISSIFDDPAYLRWLLGQSVAYISVVTVMGLWIRSLSKEIRSLRKLNELSAQRNEKLSDDFIRVIENAARERSFASEARRRK